MTINIENLAEKVGEILKQHGLKLATAESCTGGGLAYTITNIAGSSAWFERGFIVYSNEAKIEMLAVKSSTINKFGAVSEQVAREMAEGALKNSNANISIAITGIAGPEGGTDDKPVGSVWIAWAGFDKKIKTSLDIFSGDRQAVRARSIEKALEELLERIS